MPGAPGGAIKAGGAGRGGEIDAQREVRQRMPLRFLDGTLGTVESDAPVVLVPSIENVLALAPEMARVQREGRPVIVDSDGDLPAGLGLITAHENGLVSRASRVRSVEWVAEYLKMVRAADL